MGGASAFEGHIKADNIHTIVLFLFLEFKNIISRQFLRFLTKNIVEFLLKFTFYF